MKTLSKEREQLKRKGYTLVKAAEIIGVHHVHLMRVLNGERISKKTLKAAQALPDLRKKGNRS